MHLKGKKILKAAITAVGGYTPKTILSNHKLETMVDTSDEWIRSRTGIKSVESYWMKIKLRPIWQ